MIKETLMLKQNLIDLLSFDDKKINILQLFNNPQASFW
jgi:hypothetical protein